jgi:hypothetical protein
MTLPQPFPTHHGRCLATWNQEQGQYVIACVCTPQEVRALRIARRQELAQGRAEAKKRDDAPLYRKPFSLLR